MSDSLQVSDMSRFRNVSIDMGLRVGACMKTKPVHFWKDKKGAYMHQYSTSSNENLLGLMAEQKN